jgi:hypothetical protein
MAAKSSVATNGHKRAAAKRAKAASSTQEVRATYVENWAGEAQALRERLIFLCENLAPTRGRYQYLESRTSIGASKWQNVFIGRQMPSIEMLAAMCHYRLDYALWLMTGTATGTGLLAANRVPSKEEWDRFTVHRAWVKDRKAAGEHNE